MVLYMTERETLMATHTLDPQLLDKMDAEAAAPAPPGNVVGPPALLEQP